jgi:prepilin-type N-terminal cleavage/methylation domain-containing protein
MAASSNAGSPPRRRASSRGFTITELMLVMAIIGILSAISFPRFYNVLRDRKLNKAAIEMMTFYRTAKTRALGRGAATMVRWSQPASSPALLEMREAVQDSSLSGGQFTNALPNTSCTATLWSNIYQGPNGSRQITIYNTASGGQAGAIQMGIYTFNGPTEFVNQSALGPQSYVELCYTPRGRTFIRYGSDGVVFNALASVPRIDVQNAMLAPIGAGVTRSILVPPNGVARLAL